MVAVPINLVAALPSNGVTIDPMTTPKWTGQVNGDFIQVGNGVLVCDPYSWSTSYCSNLHAGSNGYYNDDVRMAYNVPANTGWVNGSSATVTVPAGARVVYAKLFWAGNTGFYNDGSSLSPGCQSSGGYYSAPSSSLTMGTVSININNDLHCGWGRDAGSSGERQLWDRDLLLLRRRDHEPFRELPVRFRSNDRGRQRLCTQGSGCFGGWALDVVYDFGAYVPGNTQSQKRAIYQFDGHVRQFDGDPNQTITLTGLNPQGTGARAGFVAYEGDRAIGGDVVRYSDSTTASGPLTGQVRANNNMWVGYAQGATRYYGTATDFYNASVDAYSLTLPGLVTVTPS